MAWLGYITIQGKSGKRYRFWKHDKSTLLFPWFGCYVLIKVVDGKNQYVGSGISDNIGETLKGLDLSEVDFICTHTDINRQNPSACYQDVRRV